MNRVSGLGAVASPARRGRVTGGFALAGGAAEAATGLAATGGVAALLAVQEDGRGGQRAAEQAMQRAEAGLAELQGLQLDLLRGGADPARLARLGALADSPEGLADPALREAALGIALRVRVEIARQRRAHAAWLRDGGGSAASQLRENGLRSAACP